MTIPMYSMAGHPIHRYVLNGCFLHRAPGMAAVSKCVGFDRSCAACGVLGALYVAVPICALVLISMEILIGGASTAAGAHVTALHGMSFQTDCHGIQPPKYASERRFASLVERLPRMCRCGFESGSLGTTPSTRDRHLLTRRDPLAVKLA